MSLIKYWIVTFLVSVSLISKFDVGNCVPNPEDHGMKSSRVEIITVTSTDGETSKTKQVVHEVKTGVGAKSEEDDDDFFPFGDEEKDSSSSSSSKSSDNEDKKEPGFKEIDAPKSDDSKESDFKVNVSDMEGLMLTAINTMREAKNDKKVKPLERGDKMSADAKTCCKFYAEKNQVVECPEFSATAFSAFSTSRTDQSNKELCQSALKMWTKSGVINNTLRPEMHDLGCGMTRNKGGTRVLLFIAPKP